ncbi:uncharacterized protein LOC108037203 [Drosophila rhopaloa]|uniref:Uncharacterized protein n=1 Tax=Drosophila rhopaloa TaxID=1041015 RepID=A0ABM5GTY7_DRORH|nr:uncharacterized protein LOC108037203 [Drosophila rhopaloa]
MSNHKEICGGGLESKCSSEDAIEKPPGHKMITSQECLQLKRDLESGAQDEFEVSPMILCLMLTFLLFVIGFWIWLISKSCLFAQSDGNGKKSDSYRRLSGGSNPKPITPNVRFLERLPPTKEESSCKQTETSDTSSEIKVSSQRWKSCPLDLCREVSNEFPTQGILKANYCNLMELPTTSTTCIPPVAELESGAVAEIKSGSTLKGANESFSSQSCPRISPMPVRNGLDVSTSQAVAGSPLIYGSMPSNFGRENTVPKRKYRIKWSNFMNRGHRDHIDTQSTQ